MTTRRRYLLLALGITSIGYMHGWLGSYLMRQKEVDLGRMALSVAGLCVLGALFCFIGSIEAKS